VGSRRLTAWAMVRSHQISYLLLGLFFQCWRWRWYVPPKYRLIFNGLHSIIAQKIELFIVKSV
jgi:hypothetical protein